MTRKLERWERSMALRSWKKILSERSDGKLRSARKVTRTGYWRSCSGRRTCHTPGSRPFGVRPAPARHPPQLRGTGRASCFGPLRAILNRHSFGRLARAVARDPELALFGDHPASACGGEV